tara:strand:+ start:1433 stop:2272 length:840 start_codon:yes stop_codon:yes gene_type:complete
MKEVNKIGNPYFLISVLVLVLNDWYLKSTFHNDITGKLSDFAGLLAFPFLLSLVFTKSRRTVHIITGILFVYWNSELAQPLIDLVNKVGLPINRTVDFTDNIALISILISYKFVNHPFNFNLKPLFQKVVFATSCLAFMATSLPKGIDRKYVDINKEYEFEFSKRELVTRLNMVQMDRVLTINKMYREVDFNAESNVFHFKNSPDTLALLLDPNKVGNSDTIVFKTSYAEIILSGDEKKSKLKLLSVYRMKFHKSDEYYKAKAIRLFEKKIIKKIYKFQ